MTAITDIHSAERDKSQNVKGLDDFLNMGRYSLLIAVICELMILNQAGNLFFMVFGGAPPTVIGCQNQTLSGLAEGDLCSMYHNGTCEPILDYQFLSANVEWNHICGDGKQIKDSTSYQMAGYILGSLFIGQVSDIYGRKWPMFVCLMGTFIFGIASAFSRSLLVFTITRTLISFFSAGHICIVLVFMCETFPKKHRMWITFILSWSPNIIILSAMAYFCGDWWKFSIALNALAGVAGALLCFAHESLFWLIGMGRVGDAEENLRKVSKFDGQNINVTDLQIVLENEKRSFEEKKSDVTYSYQHLVYSWKLASFTWAIGFSYFAISVVHYGILFNMETISGSMYFNMMFVGIVRFILNLASAFAEYNFDCVGRKTSQMIYSTYASLAIFAILGIQAFGYDIALAQLIRFLTITGGSVICQIYAVNAVSANEIFPTPIRNIAYSVMFLSESVGTAFGPQIYELNSLHTLMPYLVMFVFTVVQAVFFAWFIPESKGEPLADKMPGPEERIFRRTRASPKTSAEA